jgi:hypothetical protein
MKIQGVAKLNETKLKNQNQKNEKPWFFFFFL